MTLTSLESIVEAVRKKRRPARVAIAPCAEEFIIRSALAAHNEGIAEPIFIGDRARTLAVAAKHGLDIDGLEFHEENDDKQAVSVAVSYFKEGRADLIMKGLISTSVVLKAILNKQTGIATKGIISLVSAFEAPTGDRLVLLTDPGVNIKPNLQRKADILRNALEVARKLGIEKPKAAILAATEKVNYPAMPATLDADILSKMSAEGAFGDAIVAGPLALDLAISSTAAQCKGIENVVVGCADILLTPEIESGNILYKALTTIAGKTMASVVVGSEVPIVVASRGDSDSSKFNSMALASYLAGV